MALSKSRVDGSALDDQELANLLNARNFAYFCNMVDTKACAFCELNLELNVVSAENETSRMWPCPPKFKAKDVGEHLVIAPKQHTRHFAYLDSDEHDSFVSLFLDNVVPRLHGEPMMLSFGEEHPVLHSQVHAEFIVPDRTQRIQAEFVTPAWRLAADFMIAMDQSRETLSCLKEQDGWICALYPKTFPGIARRYIIQPSKDKFGNQYVRAEDYRTIFSLFSWLTEGELGYNAGSGTFLLTLPGAAFSMRCGDISYTAASQLHLHGNFKTPADPKGTLSETLAKDPADIAQKQRVVDVWWKMLHYIRKHENASEEDAYKALKSDDQALLDKRK